MHHFLASSRKKRKVLAVDDEMVNRELLEAILSLNYEVVSATNGEEAMEILHSEYESISLILLDLLMPKMSGFQVIEACKKDDNLKRIPIIVMTSEKSAEVRSIRMGADDFITKPYRMPEVILARCERIIELSEEKRLIRSVERDKVTGLYIKVFFDAYIRQIAPDIRRAMDVAVIRFDRLPASPEDHDAVLKKAASLIKEVVLTSKGIACRTDDNYVYLYRQHREDHEAMHQSMDELLSSFPPARGVSVRVGIYQRVDKDAPIESWFERAKAACDGISPDDPDRIAIIN